MKRNTSIRLELPYLYIVTVFFLTFNAVKYWPIPGAITIASGIGILLPFLICRSFFRTRLFLLLILYALVVLLNFISGDKYFGNSNSLFIGFVSFFVSLSLTYFVFKNKEYNLMRVIFYMLVVVLLWTTIATTVFDMSAPGIVRYAYGLRQEGSSDAVMLNPLYFWGLSDYPFSHAMPILIPPFIMGLRNSSLKMRQRILSGFMALCCIMLTYFSGATGPMLVSLMILFISLLIRRGSSSSNIFKIVFIALLLLPFILRDDIMLAGLDWIDGLLGGEGYFHNKVVDFQDSIIYGASGDVEQRQGLYSNSVEAFIDNPWNILIGAQEGYGGHSALLDRLASLGLIGFIPLVCLFVIQIKFIIKHIAPQYHIYYYIGLFAAFMMLASKNVSGWNMWFFLFSALPFCIYIYSNSDN